MGRKRYSRKKTNLICMYRPVAMAAGEANLVTDEVSAEDGWTATALPVSAVHTTGASMDSKHTPPQRLLRNLLGNHDGDLDPSWHSERKVCGNVDVVI